MFKKDIQPGARTKVKSSVQRAIRAKILETYPLLEPYIDDILPKKAQLDSLKLPDRCTLYALPNAPLFWQHMDDALLPHLTLVHKYPTAFHRVRIDRGAIRFVLSGAALMTPGLTSPGGRLPGQLAEKKAIGSGKGALAPEEEKEWIWGDKDLEEGDVVTVCAEGKEHACLVGVLKMGTEKMKKEKKGVCLDGGHFLGDGLWKLNLD